MASFLDLLNSSDGRSGLLGNLRAVPAEAAVDRPAPANFVSNNPLALMALGAGIAQGGVGRGLQLAVPALNVERQERGRGAIASATYDALRAAGLPHGQALAGALHPEVLKVIARSGFAASGDAPANGSTTATEGSEKTGDAVALPDNLTDVAALGRHVTAINSAIRQLGALTRAYPGVSPSTIADADSERGSTPLASKSPALQDSRLQREPMIDRIKELFRASGIDDAQTREWGADMSKAKSNAHLAGPISRALRLMEPRLKNLEAEHQRTTGRLVPQLLSPNAVAELQNLRDLAKGEDGQ